MVRQQIKVQVARIPVVVLSRVQTLWVLVAEVVVRNLRGTALEKESDLKMVCPPAYFTSLSSTWC